MMGSRRQNNRRPQSSPEPEKKPFLSLYEKVCFGITGALLAGILAYNSYDSKPSNSSPVYASAVNEKQKTDEIKKRTENYAVQFEQIITSDKPLEARIKDYDAFRKSTVLADRDIKTKDILLYLAKNKKFSVIDKLINDCTAKPLIHELRDKKKEFFKELSESYKLEDFVYESHKDDGAKVFVFYQIPAKELISQDIRDKAIREITWSVIKLNCNEVEELRVDDLMIEGFIESDIDVYNERKGLWFDRSELSFNTENYAKWAEMMINARETVFTPAENNEPADEFNQIICSLADDAKKYAHDRRVIQDYLISLKKESKYNDDSLAQANSALMQKLSEYNYDMSETLDSIGDDMIKFFGKRRAGWINKIKERSGKISVVVSIYDKEGFESELTREGIKFNSYTPKSIPNKFETTHSRETLGKTYRLPFVQFTNDDVK